MGLHLHAGARRAAAAISVIVHPFVVPIPVFALLAFAGHGGVVREAVPEFLVASFFSTLLIVAVVALLLRFGAVASIEMDDRRDRPLPLLAGVACYLIGFLLSRLIDASTLVQALLFCYASNTLVILFITRYWKISIHATAAAGASVALAFAFGWWAWPAAVLALLVAIARVILGKHTTWQVIAGICAGAILTWIQMQFLFAA
ncbi:MAG: hypothetical protein ACLFP4_16055 [Spirochaetales bacterium]